MLHVCLELGGDSAGTIYLERGPPEQIAMPAPIIGACTLPDTNFFLGSADEFVDAPAGGGEIKLVERDFAERGDESDRAQIPIPLVRRRAVVPEASYPSGTVIRVEVLARELRHCRTTIDKSSRERA